MYAHLDSLTDLAETLDSTANLSELECGAMSILVRRAKNDPFGDGRLSDAQYRKVPEEMA